jgi:hypothetical protein
MLIIATTMLIIVHHAITMLSIVNHNAHYCHHNSERGQRYRVRARKERREEKDSRGRGKTQKTILTQHSTEKEQG